MAEDAEVMKVLESLVADNENLKHDNTELRNLLTETREDLRALQEEVEEHRASVPSTCTNNCIY
jgi:regulator of replication initiation timing